MPETMNMSPHAVRILHNAQLEAQRLHAHEIEAEHVFLALINDEGSIPTAILRDDLQLKPEQVKQIVDLISAKFRVGSAPDGTLPVISARWAKLGFVAGDDAERSGRAEVDVEHLLLGVAASDDRFMRDVFKRLNLKPEQIRQKVHKRFPEIPLQPVRRGSWRARLRQEFTHNIAYYVPQPIRKLFGRWIDPTQPPPLG